MDTKIEPVKAKVLIEKAIYPLLHETLNSMPIKMRADKIRQLAMLGLITELNGLVPAISNHNEPEHSDRQQMSTGKQELDNNVGEDFSMY